MCSFYLTALTNTFRPVVLGVAIGAAIAIPLYFTVPQYAAFWNWQLQHPLVLLPAALAGVALGWFLD